MKLTLVVDTEDPEGVSDSLKIIKHFAMKHTTPRYGLEVKYSKIPFIKMLRRFAKDAKLAEEIGEDTTGLRFTKRWADEIFSELRL